MGCGSSTGIVSVDAKRDVAVQPSNERNESLDRLSGKISSCEKDINKHETRTDESIGRKILVSENKLLEKNENEEKVEGRKGDIDKTKDSKEKKNPPSEKHNAKEEIIEKTKENNNAFDFTHIDTHALKAPRCRSTRALADYLMKGSTDQLYIARSFYRWITENISYDTESFFGINRQPVDATSVLRLRTAVCAGYANLFEALCKHAGIKVKVISGYSKGYSYDPDTPITYNSRTSHAWNVINIDNQWRFVECTWGAGYLNDLCEFQKSYDDFYFLTDPKDFINDHFPFMDNDIEGSKKWQLLEQPFTIEEYSATAKLSKHAMKWGLKFSYHGAVKHVNTTFEVDVEDTRGVLIDSMVLLTNSDGRVCDQYVFFRRVEPTVFKVTIRLPKLGKFILEVYGKVDSQKEKLDSLVMYSLECHSVDSNFQPYPKHSGLWGVKSKAYDIGFQPSIASDVLFKTLNGKLSLELPVKSVPASMLQLAGASSKEDMERFALLESKPNALKVHIRLPHQEFYKLEVYCKTDNSTSYRPVMSFLIDGCHGTLDKAIPFPKIFPQTQEYLCELLEPTIGILQAKTTITIRFKSPKLVKGFVHGTNYTDLKITEDVWEAQVTTNEPGTVLSVNGNDTGEGIPDKQRLLNPGNLTSHDMSTYGPLYV